MDSMRSAMRWAVAGARRMPLRKCPEAMKWVGEMAPRMGRSSGVPGRKEIRSVKSDIDCTDERTRGPG